LTLEEIEAMREEAKTIIDISAPSPSVDTQVFPTEIFYVIAIIVIGIIAVVIFMKVFKNKMK
jgi:hypothetical protein